MSENNRRSRRKNTTDWTGTAVRIAAFTAVAYGAYQWMWPKNKNNRNQRNEEDPSETERTVWASQSIFSPNSPTRLSSPQLTRRWKMRRQRMTRCRAEVAAALAGFWPTVVQQIASATDTQRVAKELRELRQKKRDDNDNDDIYDLEQLQADGWRTIQEETLTRLLATAYAHAILFLVLTTQVHLLGGRLLVEATSNSSADGSSAAFSSASTRRLTDYQTAHRSVLQHTYTYFLSGNTNSNNNAEGESPQSEASSFHTNRQDSNNSGLQALIHTVRQAVRHGLDRTQGNNHNDDNDDNPASGAVHKGATVTVAGFQVALDEMRSLIEDGLPLSSSSSVSSPNHSTPTYSTPRHHRNLHQHKKPRSILRFLVPPMEEDGILHGDDAVELDDLARAILFETWDLVESPVFLDAQVDAWNTTFDLMRQHWTALFEDNTKVSSPASANSSNRTAIPPSVPRPWAQILPQLKHTTRSFSTPPPPSLSSANSASQGLSSSSSQAMGAASISPNRYASLLQALPTVLELADVSFS